MTRTQRLRRIGILCCHFLRNLAFYKSGWKSGYLIAKDQFFVNANGNFLDICVLEWCKIFGDTKSKHYWRKFITDQDAFFIDLLESLNLTEYEFDTYTKTMRTYRDKFVAHLDSEEVMHLPKLRVARKSVSFLYEYMLVHEEIDGCFHDAPPKASKFYEHYFRRGRKAYSR